MLALQSVQAVGSRADLGNLIRRCQQKVLQLEVAMDNIPAPCAASSIHAQATHHPDTVLTFVSPRTQLCGATGDQITTATALISWSKWKHTLRNMGRCRDLSRSCAHKLTLLTRACRHTGQDIARVKAFSWVIKVLGCVAHD